MAIFKGLDSPSSSQATGININSGASASPPLDHVTTELLKLAKSKKGTIETKIGLATSARIVLDIIHIAQKAQNYRKACVDIADQTYQLLNALDGGVKGRAIDVNDILREHTARFIEYLIQIRKLLKRFAEWWNLSRLWKAPRRLRKCQDILDHSMEMFLRLLRCSIVQPMSGKHLVYQKRWNTIPSRAFARHSIVEQRPQLERNTKPRPRIAPPPPPKSVPRPKFVSLPASTTLPKSAHFPKSVPPPRQISRPLKSALRPPRAEPLQPSRSEPWHNLLPPVGYRF